MLGQTEIAKIYMICRINTAWPLLKFVGLSNLPKSFYGPLTWQNWRCELGWCSLRQSHIYYGMNITKTYRYMLYDSLILCMALVGLSVISIFNCKSNYRSHILRQTMEKTMDNACWMMNYYSLCVDLHLYIHFMHSLARGYKLLY